MADSLFLQTLITDHSLITLRAESPSIFLEISGFSRKIEGDSARRVVVNQSRRYFIRVFQASECKPWEGGGGVTPYNGRYGEALPERGTFFRLQVYERLVISLAEVYRRAGKPVISVGKLKGPKGLTDVFYACEKFEIDLFIF